MTQYAKELAFAIAQKLDNKKARDVQIIDISGISILADCFVVASGTNAIQVKALCDDVVEALDEKKVQCLRIDGYAAGRWIVLDAADVIVHVFHQEERAFYNLERLWSNGTNTQVFTGEEK